MYLPYVHMNSAVHCPAFVRIICAILDYYGNGVRHAQVLAFALWMIVTPTHAFYDKLEVLQHIHDDVFDNIETDPCSWELVEGVCKHVRRMARKRRREALATPR